MRRCGLAWPWGAPVILTAVVAPLPALAAELDWAGIHRYASSEQVASIVAFSDLRPSDWAYQALSNLVDRYGCAGGQGSGMLKGNQAMTRIEAAALLQTCLERISQHNESIERLKAELAQELAWLKGRTSAIEARVGALEAQQFSTTTKLSVEAYMVLGGNGFYGSDSAMVTDSRNRFGAVTFNYDLRLTLDTSFSGRDLLRTRLRSGNFNVISNSFYGAGPSPLSQLEAAFQEPLGPNIVSVERLFYQVPLGAWTITLGGLVEQDDMLAMFPSVYPDSTLLDMFTMAGTPVAYDFNIGPGAGIWWKQGDWSLSLNYIAQGASSGNPGTGGLGTSTSRSSTTLQLGVQQEQWALALVYSAIQGGVSPYSTEFMQTWLNDYLGMFHTLGLSGFWQPIRHGWLPSISAGAEVTQLDYSEPAPPEAARTAVAWSVGLQWLDVFTAGNSAGMAIGQAPFATSLVGGGGINDANWMGEWWYKIQVSDAISVTPGLFYLSRPLGQNTPAGESFNQLGALIKTQFRF